MVQNVNSAQTQNTKSSGGLLGGIKSTLSTALPGVVLGGGVGAGLSLVPPSKSAIKEQIKDVFEAEANNELKSDYTKQLINRPELKEIKEKFATDMEGALDDLIKKLPKSDELIKFAKKAAKSKNTKNLIKNGAMFGAISMLIVSLIQSRRPKEQ